MLKIIITYQQAFDTTERFPWVPRQLISCGSEIITMDTEIKSIQDHHVMKIPASKNKNQI